MDLCGLTIGANVGTIGRVSYAAGGEEGIPEALTKSPNELLLILIKGDGGRGGNLSRGLVESEERLLVAEVVKGSIATINNLQNPL